MFWGWEEEKEWSFEVCEFGFQWENGEIIIRKLVFVFQLIGCLTFLRLSELRLKNWK